MSESKLIELGYYDPSAKIRLSAYADTVVLDPDKKGSVICAIRFGGYPEMVRAMADAIYGGATIEATQNDMVRKLQSKLKGYQRQITHDGVYAVATLMAADDAQEEISPQDEDGPEDDRQKGAEEVAPQKPAQPRKCYIFCPEGDRVRLFEELDHKTAAPLIPAFQDYVLTSLQNRGDLRQLEVISQKERIDAWVLTLKPEDKNVVEVLEEGLKTGDIQIPGTVPGFSDGFEKVNNVTEYLNTFGVTVAARIRNQFMPLFDPASEPLSDEVLAINDFVTQHAGYSLYDAQLAVAEAVKRQLERKRAALIIAECGSGKTKIGSTALGALHGLWASQKKKGTEKSFNIIMCPSHVTKKWVREIGETLPDTYAMVVSNITDLNRLYAMYERGDKSVYAVFSKERARDGYMRGPAVRWNRRRRAFLCPDCDAVIEMDINEDGISYTVPADQFFFLKENKLNHKCLHCGAPLWSAVNPSKRTEWVKIGEYGWVHRYGAAAHLKRTKNEKVIDQLMKIAEDPDGYYPIRGAQRRYPLSTYIKKKLRGFLCDELHEYNNASGQGDAMAELYGTAKLFVGMTATLINGYSSGIFHLLYRIVPGLMLKDDKRYRKPGDFNAEYGVVENTYEIEDTEYNSNRRANKRKTKSRLLPGVSPLVFSRFLLEYAAFLSLTDMNKDLPSYEEIPIALEMPENVRKAYEKAENILQKILRSGTGIAQKILSAYLNLLTVYPDQPYDQPEIVHPIDGSTLVEPENCGDFSTLLPKEEAILNLVQQKVEDGERVLIYTSWTRTDSQQKLLKLLRENGYRTEILTKQIPTEKREEWVDKRVKSGLQVLITNPRCVETGLDLNAFTTIIYYSMGYNLFTLRQASRRSWRINQTAPKVEVYMFYYANTMQAKAMKLMASKLAVAGIIEGTFSEEGLAAMSDVKDLTSQMAKELAAGIRDNVEDIAAAFKKMAIINPNRKKNVQEETNVESSSAPEVVSEPRESSVRTAQAAAIWERYEGLLARTNEEKKKRKSKVAEVDENQLSIFDFAA